MNMLFDIKYALRTLLGKPQFTSLSVVVMAAGLGLTVFILTFLSNLLYKDLPFADGENVYSIQSLNPEGERTPVSFLDYDEIKKTSRNYSHIGAYNSITTVLSDGESSRRYMGTSVTTNIFEFTQMSAQLGRTFNDEDLLKGATPVTVISYNLWKDYFQANKNIIGKTIKVAGKTTEIIGVMPPEKVFPVYTDLWLPSIDDALRIKKDASPLVGMYVRKLPDVSYAQANAELSAIMQRLAAQDPEGHPDTRATLVSFQRQELGDETFDVIQRLMTIAVILVLFLACINVSNLLLTRANERSKETAIRLALGAPRIRLIMQMMWESVLICFLGGILGLFAAAYGIELLNASYSSWGSNGVPFWWYGNVDGNIMLQALALIVITAFITGIFPAWKMSQCNVNAELRDGTRGAVSKKSGRVSRILVIVEVALSCLLLILSTVLYVILEDSKNVDFGADIENKLQARTVLPKDRFDSESEKIQYFQRLLSELKNIPGVSSAGSMSTMPGIGTRLKNFTPEGYEVNNHKYPQANRISVFAESMQALDIGLKEGRYFDLRDTKSSQPVAIITQGMAEKYWPNTSALGKRFEFSQEKEKQWLTVVGVVNHVMFSGGVGDRRFKDSIFQPYSQDPRHHMSNFITVDEQSENNLSEITQAVAKVDPLVPTYDVFFLRKEIENNLVGFNLIRDIFSIFAVAALILAATGIYGVLSNTTSRRTQELGIRRALGASDENVMALLMKQGWMQLLIGLVIGLPLGYLVSLGLVNIIIPESNHYYYVFLVIPLLITIVVSVATYFPAKKAISLAPSSALRYE